MNPLDQLRDLHLPPEPGLWPPAPGWWLLATLIAIGAIVALHLYLQRRRKNRYRRTALAELHTLASLDNPLKEVLSLVRRVAKTTDRQSTWPSLPSKELLQRLDSAVTGKLSRAWGDDWNRLATDLYRPEASKLNETQRQALINSVARWIRRHRRQSLC